MDEFSAGMDTGLQTIQKKEFKVFDITEIGEMAGRNGHEEGDLRKKATVREYLSWLLFEKAWAEIKTNEWPDGPNLDIAINPKTQARANIDNERVDWEKNLFAKEYPEVSDEELAKLDFSQENYLCLAALGRGPEDWEEHIAYLREKLGDKAKVIFINTPEVGQRIKKGGRRKYTLQRITTYVGAEIARLEDEEKLNPGKITFLTHSRGGLEAALYAVDHPEKVKEIIGMSVPFKPEGRAPAGWMMPLLRTLKRLPLDRMLDILESGFDIERTSFTTMLKKATAKNCIATYLELLQYPWDKLLSRIPLSVKFVVSKGKEDGALDAGGFEAPKDRPGSVLIGVPGSGHEKLPKEYLLRIIVREFKKAKAVAL